MCFVCSCMDPLPHPNSAMERIWGLWVDKCVICDILLWDTWQLMPKWQDSSRTLFPLQAKQNPLSYSCSYLPKSPSWGTVQLPCCPWPLLPHLNSHHTLVKVTVAQEFAVLQQSVKERLGLALLPRKTCFGFSSSLWVGSCSQLFHFFLDVEAWG